MAACMVPTQRVSSFGSGSKRVPAARWEARCDDNLQTKRTDVRVSCHTVFCATRTMSSRQRVQRRGRVWQTLEQEKSAQWKMSRKQSKVRGWSLQILCFVFGMVESRRQMELLRVEGMTLARQRGGCVCLDMWGQGERRTVVSRGAL